LYNFTLAIFLAFVVRLNLRIRDLFDHLNNVFRFSNETDELLIFRFQKLKQRPNGYMLESGITTRKEAAEISVNASVGLGPVLNED
jgi:hypothetical protein